MSKQPKISVCVPTYNRYKDLKNLIKSYLNLTYPNSELVIFDDLGSPDIKKIVIAFGKKDKRIIYCRNKKNLGFTENLRQTFTKVDNKIILFMGDDDLFIDPKTLDYFVQAFTDPKVGVVKACQILYKTNKVDQAFPLPDKNNVFTTYQAGLDTFNNLWFESLSITGLAFRNDVHLRNLLNHHLSLYPQVELMGKVCLTKKSVRINKHLVGVQSHSGQLNCATYDLNEVRTNILEDWMHIYRRIKLLAKKQKQPFMSQSDFSKQFTKFLVVFYPYNTLTNGKLDTLMLIANSFKYYPLLWLNWKFIASTFTVFVFPKKMIKKIIKFVKKIKLKIHLDKKQTAYFNYILFSYYN